MKAMEFLTISLGFVWGFFYYFYVHTEEQQQYFVYK